MKLLPIIFSLLALCSFAQPTDENEETYDQRLSVKISPLSFITPYTGPCAKLSVEYKPSHIAFQQEFGMFFYSSKGFETKSEVKYYTHAEEYFSIEAFYKNQRYTTPDIIDTSDTYDQDYVILHPFDVWKNVGSLSFKYGTLKVFRYGFVTDIYCGIGIRVQQTHNSLSAEDNASMPPTSDYGPNLILDKARTLVYPNIVLGVKIGWRILK